MAKPTPDGIPKAARPWMPAGYGISKASAGLLPWSHVEERMARLTEAPGDLFVAAV